MVRRASARQVSEAVVAQRALAEQDVQALATEKSMAWSSRTADIRPVAVLDRLEEQRTQRPALEGVPETVEDFASRGFQARSSTGSGTAPCSTRSPHCRTSAAPATARARGSTRLAFAQ